MCFQIGGRDSHPKDPNRFQGMTAAGGPKDIKRPHKHKDRTDHAFWYPPCIGPWNQHVRSLCLSVFFVSLPGSNKRPHHFWLPQLSSRV